MGAGTSLSGARRAAARAAFALCGNATGDDCQSGRSQEATLAPKADPPSDNVLFRVPAVVRVRQYRIARILVFGNPLPDYRAIAHMRRSAERRSFLSPWHRNSSYHLSVARVAS